MLHSWTSGTSNRSKYIPFSFSDRGNMWAAERVDTGATGLGRNDFGGVAAGLMAGTLVATELGWQPVDDLRTGDRIVTFDNGMRPLKAVRVSTLWTAEQDAPANVWPMHVPARALGNREAIQMMPEQSVLIESDEAQDLFGDPFMLVAAGVLDGFKGITRVPPQREVTVVALEFEGDEVVYVNGTLLVYCPADRIEMVASAEDMMRTGTNGHYQRLTDTQGRRLVAAMHAA